MVKITPSSHSLPPHHVEKKKKSSEVDVKAKKAAQTPLAHASQTDRGPSLNKRVKKQSVSVSSIREIASYAVSRFSLNRLVSRITGVIQNSDMADLVSKLLHTKGKKKKTKIKATLLVPSSRAKDFANRILHRQSV